MGNHQWLERALSSVPLLPVAAGMVVGIFAHQITPGLIAPAVLLVIAAGWMVIGKTRVAIPFMAGFVGWLAAYVAAPKEFTELPGKSTVYYGTVEDVKISDTSRRLIVEVDKSAVDAENPKGKSIGEETLARLHPAECKHFRAILTLPFYTTDFLPGDCVAFNGTYSLPQRETDLPLENDMVDVYRHSEVSLLVYVPENHIVKVGEEWSLPLGMKRWRDELVGLLYRTELTPSAATFLAAILAGDTDDIGVERRSEYAAIGVAHILALSGIHVAIIVFFLGWILLPLEILLNRKWRWGGVVVLLWGFVLLTGASVSVVRSALMFTAIIVSIMIDRPRSSVNSLLFAAVAILLFRPMSLFIVGFQLSFVATLGIILCSERLNPFTRRSAWFKVVSPVVVAVSASLFTMPLVVYYFHQFPLGFIGANLVAGIVLPVMIAGGLVFVGLALVGVSTGWLAVGINWVDGVFNKFVGWFSERGFVNVEGIYIEWWMVVLLFVSIALLTFYVYRMKRALLVASVAVLVVEIGVSWYAKPTYRDNVAYFVRDKQVAMILYHHGDTLTLMTTDSRLSLPADSAMVRERYRDFIATRGIKVVAAYCHTDTACRFIGADGVVRLGERTLIFDGVNRDSLAVDYCIVTKAFKGNVLKLAGECRADTLLLTGEINKRRRTRYGEELRGDSCRFVDLSERRFWIDCGKRR